MWTRFSLFFVAPLESSCPERVPWYNYSSLTSCFIATDIILFYYQFSLFPISHLCNIHVSISFTSSQIFYFTVKVVNNLSETNFTLLIVRQ